MTWTGRASDGAYLLGWRAVRLLPEPVARAAFRRIADSVWAREGGGVRQLKRNLRRVLGPQATAEQIEVVSKAGMRSYLRYWCEVFRLPTWDADRILGHTRCIGEDYLREMVESDRGVILALPHLANWDQAGAWLTTLMTGFTTVAERLQPESLYRRFLAYREGLGMEVLPLTGGADVFATLTDRLRKGGTLCLVADRDLTARGIEVEFFGETTKMPAGPASLALETGAALVPVTLWYDGDDLQLHVHPEIEPPSGTRREQIASMTQALASIFEAGIREHPEDWHMLQKLWLSDLEKRQ